MAQISASLVKELRDKTGAGMMDCKKALVETDGDLEAAVDWLRKKGIASAAKKAGRTAADGLIGTAVDGTSGAIVEVNSETDFVARNPDFQTFVKTVAGVALATDGSLDAVLGAPYPGASHSVADELTEMVAKIGENLVIRRTAKISVESGLIGEYVHNKAAPSLGKIGVLVGLQSPGDASGLQAFGHQLAMHVAAAVPPAQAIDRDGVDPAALERERAILTEQAAASGKPENVIEKMVEGRLRKFYEEVVLLEQQYVIDPDSKQSVGKTIEAKAKELGSSIQVTAFQRFALGEGIEKDETDFAAEVAAQISE